MREKLKFNVIIPTRERGDTLYHCLHTVVAQDYENLNIIVSDNFSQDGTFEVVKSFKDARIQYVNTGSRMSMSHNWEFALNHVTDGWVMFIGDDDGICPGAIELLNHLVQEHQVEAVSSAHGVFIWPDHFVNDKNGVLSLPLTNSVSVKNSRLEFGKVFAGKMGYQNLPYLYHGGAASLDLINRLRDKSGRFFCSQIPDLYSAVAFSVATEKFLSIGIPLVIAGSSKHSTGASNYSDSPNSGSNPIAQFKAEKNIPFHESLILGKSLQVMLYESYLQSSHVHRGEVVVSLETQLRAAIRAAPAVHGEEILAECRTIAIKNGFLFSYTYGKVERLLGSVARIFVTSRVAFFRLQLDAKELGLQNIYDATVASACLYRFMRNRPWLLFLLGVKNLANSTILKLSRFFRHPR